MLGALIGGALSIARSGLGRRIGGAITGIVRGRAGRAIGTAVTAAGSSKAGRRIIKAGAGAVAAGGAFEAGGRVVRGGGGAAPPGGAIDMGRGGAVMNGGGGMAMPNGMTMKAGKYYAPGAGGRLRRVTGMDPFGNFIFAKPTLNVLNPHALRRANRRLTGFGKFAKRTLSQLAKQSREFAPKVKRSNYVISPKKK